MKIIKKNKPLPSDPVTVIPSIGKSLGEDLNNLGIFKVADLRGKSPQKLYDQLCELTHSRQDPCVLYTFRCAVYAATTPEPDLKLLKWWNWKNREK